MTSAAFNCICACSASSHHSRYQWRPRPTRMPSPYKSGPVRCPSSHQRWYGM